MLLHTTALNFLLKKNKFIFHFIQQKYKCHIGSKYLSKPERSTVALFQCSPSSLRHKKNMFYNKITIVDTLYKSGSKKTDFYFKSIERKRQSRKRKSEHYSRFSIFVFLKFYFSSFFFATKPVSYLKLISDIR